MTLCRVIRPEEMPVVLGWAAAEGWNPGVEDANAFLAADPDGVFVAEEDGAPVAAISVVNHSTDFAFLGLYLCLPEYRGRGIGLALWTYALAHAGSRTVGLDGVPAQQKNYRSSGFEPAGQTVRWQGVPPDVPTPPDLPLALPQDLERMLALENAASGWAKPKFLSAWFQQCQTRATFVDGTSGIVTVRLCQVGVKIGPLVAQNSDQARRLIAQAVVWAKAHAAAQIVLDVPQSATGMTEICRQIGLEPGFETARMYRGPASPEAPKGFYAVATLELG
ncbi:GNAT family N-acetyltransferase [Sagittula sp. NFXS13]|uniref:GNAT family N-acetyltransferase n=1 Tax=Sagittula sp. NFXS13 TaxID=2819095 RepID=UPI0032DFD55A